MSSFHMTSTRTFQFTLGLASGGCSVSLDASASVQMIDPDEQDLLDRLRDPIVSDNDKSSWLEVLEVLLPTSDVLPLLAAFISDPAESPGLKEQAEKLARSIDADFVANHHI
jgi:hypothetical protein